MRPTIRTNPSFLLLLVAVIAGFALPAASARADQISAPVSGFFDDDSNFDGTFRVNRFRSTRLGVVISGLLIGTVTNFEGQVTDVISSRVTVFVADMRTVDLNCDILLFAIDPADVDLIGMDFTLHLDPFDMNINAEANGIDLGSRLCTIANGFQNGTFTQSVALLNGVVDILANR